MKRKEGVTGRDGYIVAKALYKAAKALRLQKYPELSDADDMETLSNAWFPGSFQRYVAWDREDEGLRVIADPSKSVVSPGVNAADAIISKHKAALKRDREEWDRTLIAFLHDEPPFD